MEETSVRLKFENLRSPFPVWEPWPVDDCALEAVEAGRFLSWLPFGDPRMDEPDPLVSFFQEAYRCLAGGGMLTIKMPHAGSGACLANPLNRRFFNKGTICAFAKPPDAEDVIGGEWKWDATGCDFGTRFEVLHWAEDGGDLTAVLVKPILE